MIISITNLGMELKNKAKTIPSKISQCVNLEENKVLELYKILNKVLSNLKDE